MVRVFCVDLGYSLKAESRKWEENNISYPGQALYGINHFEQYHVKPVFEWCEHGMCWRNRYAILDEIIKAISLIKFHKDYDLIYIPHAHYSRWIIILKMFKIIRKPVVVCIHNKNNLYGLIKVCDYIITINPNLACKLRRQYNKLKIKYIPLLPEKNIKFDSKRTCEYDIVSVGNTCRDYPVLIKAMQGLPYKCLIITKQKIEVVSKNITIVKKMLSYEQCMEVYLQAKIIIVPIAAKAKDGVFGLTSLVDALYVEKPVIVTKTAGIGIPIEKNGLGREVEIGSSDEMRKAIVEMMNNQEERIQIRKNIRQFKENNSMEKSSEKICKVFNEVLKG